MSVVSIRALRIPSSLIECPASGQTRCSPQAEATYLQKELGVPVTYKPVTGYTAAVTAFKVGDLDMVWFGGLTGVQAQLQVKGALAIAQRDIDNQFHSIFIANKTTGLKPIQDINGLKELKGKY